jgi:hypothetical protein
VRHQHSEHKHLISRKKAQQVVQLAFAHVTRESGDEYRPVVCSTHHTLSLFSALLRKRGAEHTAVTLFAWGKKSRIQTLSDAAVEQTAPPATTSLPESLNEVERMRCFGVYSMHGSPQLVRLTVLLPVACAVSLWRAIAVVLRGRRSSSVLRCPIWWIRWGCDRWCRCNSGGRVIIIWWRVRHCL